MHQNQSIWKTFTGDGTNQLLLTGLILCACGLFALFQAGTKHFLPHDVAYLGMDATELCALQQCKIVHFMIHDRVSFGGVLLSIGLLYLWLVSYPLQEGESWAWWALLLSGIVGFGSFLSYLGYGYLDSWHGIGTLLLLPFFAAGLYLKRRALGTIEPLVMALHRRTIASLGPTFHRGRVLLDFIALGIVFAGGTITVVGMTSVFVPQDLEFMGLQAEELHQINPRLVPLIAHDRAGFGGGLVCYGLLLFLILRCATPSRSQWEIIALSGAVGFSTAIGIHPIIGYNSFTHLAPAVFGAAVFLIAMALTCKDFSESCVTQKAPSEGSPGA